MTPTIYLTRNGLLEPLGQSQVFAYLRGLSQDYRITLITYEKDEDRADVKRMDAMRTECASLGIRWLPQRFRPQPKVIAPALSMLRMVWLVHREARSQGARLIHARSYIPAAVGLVVSRMTGIPFIFDMRALWPEELITAGRLRRGSLLHRAIVAAERACLRNAGAVVSLTHAAVDHLNRTYPDDMAGQLVEVIPTCADLDRFVPASDPPRHRVIGCLGTVLSGWFRLDWLASFLSVAAQNDPDVIFQLTTRDDPKKVREGLDPKGLLGDRLQIAPAASQDVHRVLQQQTASVMFFTDGLGKLGSSPTRMAEILGCGIPVVANDGVGDVARVIHDYRVGVLAESLEPQAMATAWSELLALLEDPDLAARCRTAAQEVFSLETGTAAYARIYARLSRGES
ncbi:MAG: glycosyltransferase [Erythrobacter sp.]